MASRTTKGTRARSSHTTGGAKPRKATKTGTGASRVQTSGQAVAITAERRRQLIAEAAYLRAERRGFGAGDPLDDWLAAESEVDTALAQRAQPAAR